MPKIRLRGRWSRRLGVFCLGLSVLLLGGAGSYAGYTYLNDNFHVVKPGSLYRSAQPTPELLAEWKQRYGLTTVVNLRGANPGAPWYEAEKAAADRLGLRLIDYKLSAKRVLSGEETKELVSLLAGLDGPTLVHCMSGADRSGIASAYYLASVAKVGEEAAEGQLSLWYGHVPLWLSPFYAMDISFEAAEPSFGYYDS
ncbi:protein tyrosine/serine phosphatase [Rhodopseudomonas julia]|uniref:Protein tyrosine/serine phosphatase n=1 Tax=Rhodopseudomonas julia TaxID=200617 RepID=A0ABU0C1G2_9BRAD|nr:tyrosine-protein phosphatase [Rhodopseudomonas julia]MDQ0324340.1 protein tyrosine/serine phosphatase [Rhodopseudomonas julia]